MRQVTLVSRDGVRVPQSYNLQSDLLQLNYRIFTLCTRFNKVSHAEEQRRVAIAQKAETMLKCEIVHPAPIAIYKGRYEQQKGRLCADENWSPYP